MASSVADVSPSIQANDLSLDREVRYPESWYLIGSEAELRRGPIKVEILGKELVAFLTESDQAVVLENRCVHMGSQLSNGCVVGEAIQCSLHHWEFGSDGDCRHIPTADEIPAFARQKSYPAEVRHGQVYFFNGAVAHFPLPFFDDLQAEDLVAARPFVEYVDCPWYLVGANAVDVQHFAIAHDRRMMALPVVDHPTLFTHRSICKFHVEGHALADRMTRTFGGDTVALKVTDWASTMVFAHSTLERAETFGMVCMVPISHQRTKVHVTIMARRSQGVMRRLLLDPLRARVRRRLIRRFLRSDVSRLSGAVYSPHTLIEIDQQFGEYFDWLRGLTQPAEGSRQ